MKLQELTEDEASRELEFYANADNWPTDLEAAREFAANAVRKWKWQEKAPKFLRQIAKAPSIKRLQEIVIYPLLSGEGMGVIR